MRYLICLCVAVFAFASCNPCDSGTHYSNGECVVDDGQPDIGCGNGTLETNLGEECDDGNTTSGDGCSLLCLAEICGAPPDAPVAKELYFTDCNGVIRQSSSLTVIFGEVGQVPSLLVADADNYYPVVMLSCREYEANVQWTECGVNQEKTFRGTPERTGEAVELIPSEGCNCLVDNADPGAMPTLKQCIAGQIANGVATTTAAIACCNNPAYAGIELSGYFVPGGLEINCLDYRAAP